jgi:hypothetical protein
MTTGRINQVTDIDRPVQRASDAPHRLGVPRHRILGPPQRTSIDSPIMNLPGRLHSARWARLHSGSWLLVP